MRERLHYAVVDTRKGHLGVSLERPRLHLLGRTSVLVSSLVEHDLMSRAGLHRGDLILEVNGSPVPCSPNEAIALVQKATTATLSYVENSEGGSPPWTLLGWLLGR